MLDFARMLFQPLIYKVEEGKTMLKKCQIFKRKEKKKKRKEKKRAHQIISNKPAVQPRIMLDQNTKYSPGSISKIRALIIYLNT